MKRLLLYGLIFIAISFTACNTEKQPARKFIETGYMDSSIKPADNFYEFVNGKWLDKAKINSMLSDLAKRKTANKTKYDWKTIINNKR